MANLKISFKFVAASVLFAVLLFAIPFHLSIEENVLKSSIFPVENLFTFLGDFSLWSLFGGAPLSEEGVQKQECVKVNKSVCSNVCDSINKSICKKVCSVEVVEKCHEVKKQTNESKKEINLGENFSENKSGKGESLDKVNKTPIYEEKPKEKENVDKRGNEKNVDKKFVFSVKEDLKGDRVYFDFEKNGCDEVVVWKADSLKALENLEEPSGYVDDSDLVAGLDNENSFYRFGCKTSSGVKVDKNVFYAGVFKVNKSGSFVEIPFDLKKGFEGVFPDANPWTMVYKKVNGVWKYNYYDGVSKKWINAGLGFDLKKGKYYVVGYEKGYFGFSLKLDKSKVLQVLNE